jgi:hypothetical protein
VPLLSPDRLAEAVDSRPAVRGGWAQSERLRLWATPCRKNPRGYEKFLEFGGLKRTQIDRFFAFV